MITFFLPKKKFLPYKYVDSIFEVDYNKLYAQGFRLILTDLDNTLISYKDTEPNAKITTWKEELEAIGFTIIVVSNSPKSRVKHFSCLYNTKYVSLATKPLKRGYKKAIKMTNFKRCQTLTLGDQLMTDVFGSNRLKLRSFLVKSIDKKTERPITKFNRKLEKAILKDLKKKDEVKFKESLGSYYEENF